MYPADFTFAGRHLLSCIAPYGGGGLGQHFAQVVEETRAAHGDVRYYTARAKPGDEGNAIIVTDALTPKLIRFTPLRFSPGGINFLEAERFDRMVARRLHGKPASFVGFGGQSLHSFKRARTLKCERLTLLAANSHVDNVARQHADALRRWPLERSWLNEAQRLKTVREYAMADEILIASDYSWKSFVDAGLPEKKLRRIHYRVDPRFTPRASAPGDGIFRVVYIGSVTVMKGIPVLLEAFARLEGDAELTLVGGTTTSGMRRYLQAWMHRDPRIRLTPGDPLPHLQKANVCVHPSYEDNLAYAVLEALAVGVPVICSDRTGAKQHIHEDKNGWIVPTGDVEALYERMTAMKKGGTA